ARAPSLRALPWRPMAATWCWLQPFGQPEACTGSSAARASGPRARTASSTRRAMPRGRVTASRQASAPRQATPSAAEPAPSGARRLGETAGGRGAAGGPDPAEHDLAADGEPHGPVAVREGEVGEDLELRGGDVALRERHRDGEVARLPLRADVRAGEPRERLG